MNDYLGDLGNDWLSAEEIAKRDARQNSMFQPITNHYKFGQQSLRNQIRVRPSKQVIRSRSIQPTKTAKNGRWKNFRNNFKSNWQKRKQRRHVRRLERRNGSIQPTKTAKNGRWKNFRNNFKSNWQKRKQRRYVRRLERRNERQNRKLQSQNPFSNLFPKKEQVIIEKPKQKQESGEQVPNVTASVQLPKNEQNDEKSKKWLYAGVGLGTLALMGGAVYLLTD